MDIRLGKNDFTARLFHVVLEVYQRSVTYVSLCRNAAINTIKININHSLWVAESKIAGREGNIEQDIQQILSRLGGLSSIVITNEMHDGLGSEDVNELACEWVRRLMPRKVINVSIVTRFPGVVCLVRM